jgi:hypothetical protein
MADNPSTVAPLPPASPWSLPMTEIPMTALSQPLADLLEQTFAGQYMQPEIFEAYFWELETSDGKAIIPDDEVDLAGAEPGCVFDLEVAKNLHDAFRPYVAASALYTAEAKHGVLSRLSAPGFMDCTEWSCHDSFDEAARGLIESFGDDDAVAKLD